MISGKQAGTKFDLIPEISRRWSPRAFSEKEVETDKIMRLLEAARWAPSSRNEQPWRFIIARKGEEHYQKLYEGLNEWNQKWAWTAPVIGVTIALKFVESKGDLNTYSWHDVGLAMGNLLAQATHDGLFLHQMAGIYPEKITENFEVDPEKFDVVAMFALGYQDEKRLDELDERYRKQEFEQRHRKDLKELVFGSRFGSNPSWLNHQEE